MLARQSARRATIDDACRHASLSHGGNPGIPAPAKIKPSDFQSKSVPKRREKEGKS
jgi:hypothetical protein